MDEAKQKALRGLVERARQGDRSSLADLRAFLESHPEVWREAGDLALLAQNAWLRMLSGPDPLLSESVRRKMEELRAELAGPAPSPVEKLVAERIAACWLQCHYADATYATATGPGATEPVRRELMHRQESAQRRYLAAIRQLALVRRLALPAPSPLAPGAGRPRLAELA